MQERQSQRQSQRPPQTPLPEAGDVGAVGDVARPTVWMLSDIPHAGSCVFDLCLACLIFRPLAMVDKSCCCGPLAAFVVLFSALDACPKSKTELLRRRRLLRSSVFSTVFRFAAPSFSFSLSLTRAHPYLHNARSEILSSTGRLQPSGMFHFATCETLQPQRS